MKFFFILVLSIAFGMMVLSWVVAITAHLMAFLIVACIFGTAAWALARLTKSNP